VDTKQLSAADLRERMHAHGVRVGDLARAAGMDPGNLSGILHGHGYLGRGRRERIEQAIEQLELHREAPPRDEPPPHIFNVHDTE
jgi:hypothetical protein